MSYENVNDRLSRLPEEIVSHILSLMPTKFAVRTSILSKTWRYSWTMVANLEFDDSLYKPFHFIDSMIKCVDTVLNCLKTSQLSLFRLHVSGSSVGRSNVSKWIDETVRLNVRELDIHLDVSRLELPLNLFTCKTLTKLRLDRCRFCMCPILVNLPCLKILDVLVSRNSFATAFKVIGGSPMLESLSVEVSSFNSAQDYIFNIPTLKRLKLTLLCRSGTVNKFVLNVPNLEYLFVGGILCSSLVMKDVSSLVEACVSFQEILYDHLWVELLNGVSGVESFSIKQVSSTLLLPIFPNMKHLELKRFWHSRQIVQALESCPVLKHLYIEKPVHSSRVELKVVPACMLTNLTTIRILGWGWSKDDIKFMEYILGNAEVLKRITITCLNIVEDALCAQTLKLPRASRCCEIHFQGRYGSFKKQM